MHSASYPARHRFRGVHPLSGSSQHQEIAYQEEVKITELQPFPVEIIGEHGLHGFPDQQLLPLHKKPQRPQINENQRTYEPGHKNSIA